MAKLNANTSGARKEIFGLVSNVLLAVMFGVIPMPVAWKWVLWFLCWVGFLYIICLFGPINRLPRKTKVVISLLLSVGFCIFFNGTALLMWKTEMAMANSGRLFVERESFHGIHFSDSDVKLQIGTSGVFFVAPFGGGLRITEGGEVVNPNVANADTLFDFVGSKTSIKRKNGELLLTTEVRDRSGAIIINILDNEWTMQPGMSWEKNYTNNSIEVKDKRGRIVLQVTVLPDKVQLQAEWWTEYGRGIRVLEATNGGGSQIVRMDPPNFHPDEPGIKPVFVYPANKYFGDRLDSQKSFIERIFPYRAIRGY